MPRLRLIALDPDDLTVLGTHLQDSVAKLSNMTYRPQDRRFIALVNRFAWDHTTSNAARNDEFERRRAALRIERVARAQVSGLNLMRPDTIVSILTVTFTPDSDTAKSPAGVLTMHFSGGAAIRLDVECLEMMLEDLGPTWKAKTQPHHSENIPE
ncbi:MAG: DUF2948 family protein [Hyphomicrobiaceae bacterium]|nr:DUF2948 family protein [Hyphomicrobiaceae bacterium]